MENEKIYVGIGIALALLWLWNKLRTRVVSARDVFVIDGDTIGVKRKHFRPERIRISNINTGETRGFRSIWEGRKGQEAKKALKDLIFEAEYIEIISSGRKDRYGRTLARVRAISDTSTIDAGKYQIRRGLARRWT